MKSVLFFLQRPRLPFHFRDVFFPSVGALMNQVKIQLEELLRTRKADLLRRVNYYLGKSLRKKTVPEEILAESVCYFLEHPNGLESKDQEQLYNIFLWKARRVVCDRVRRLERFAEVVDELGHNYPNSESERRLTQPSPTLVLHRESKRQDLRHAIGLIPSEAQRQALWLTKMEGHSLAETAQLMNRNTQSVKKLVERGFKSLALVLKSRGKMVESTGVTS